MTIHIRFRHSTSNVYSTYIYLIEVIQDVKLPDTGVKPHDAAVLLVHFIAQEQTQTQLSWEERHTAQDGH